MQQSGNLLQPLFKRRNYIPHRLCLIILVFSIWTHAFAQVREDAVPVSKNIADTNLIVPVSYPPLTEREGKNLKIPLPPLQHPRLYLTAKDIPVLKEKLNSSLLQKCRSRIEQASAYQTTGFLPLSIIGNNNTMIRDAIEAKALQYVMAGNTQLGKEAVAAVLNYYATLKINPRTADVTREIGRAIVTGAIVYDWCYPLLTSQQKTTLIGRMETLAGQMEIQWPLMKGSSVTGHTTEAQMARDMLSFAIATYNEKPSIYNRVAGRIFSEFLPVRHFFYPSGYHHQGSAYGAYRFYWDLNSTFIFDRMGYPNLYGKEQQFIPYYFIYSRRPDGQLMRNGDDYNEQFMPFGSWWSLGQGALLFSGSYHRDPIVLNEALKERQPGETPDYLYDFLFINPISVQCCCLRKPTLPLSRYFPEPFGAMIARTGWQDGMNAADVIATMKIQSYNFSNHQHLDAGSFQLYYKGPLTVQSGIYQGITGSYGGEHFKNYSQRTIAHNTMLVYDPGEKFTWNGSDIINDGGQPYPANAHEPENMQELLTQGYHTGEVLAQGFGPDSVQPEYTYLKGELAKAYGKKVKSFQRSFVFLNLKNKEVPAALFIYDKLTATDSNYKKSWLLHCVEEPHIQGNITAISRTEKGYNGRLINTTLLPLSNNLDIQKIGGSGKEFTVQNKNYPQAMVAVNNSWDSAVWRIEVSPKKSVPFRRFSECNAGGGCFWCHTGLGYKKNRY